MKRTHRSVSGSTLVRLLPLGVFAALAVAPPPGSAQAASEECTAGVASGKATVDGRPLLWKTRDASAPNNEVIWNTSGEYHFISVITAGSPQASWMGVNEKGFAIINTQSSDLTPADSGPGNGDFMAQALGSCATVAEFQALLDATNASGRRTSTNFGVIDATGAAAFFETAGHRYWRYDAANTEKGYILRTNFAINGARDSLRARPYSMDRYLETDELMRKFFLTDGIDFKEIAKIQVRSFGDPQGHLVPLPITGSYDGQPAGYYPNHSSINRNTSVSFAVIHGVRSGEDARLSTMWTILGQPSTGILVPYWPVGATPPEADGPKTAPLDEVANQIRRALYTEPGATAEEDPPLYINTRALRDQNGNGIWKITMPVEDSIVAESEQLLAGWRASGPDVEAMLATEHTMAGRALEALKRAYAYLTSHP